MDKSGGLGGGSAKEKVVGTVQTSGMTEYPPARNGEGQSSLFVNGPALAREEWEPMGMKWG